MNNTIFDKEVGISMNPKNITAHHLFKRKHVVFILTITLAMLFVSIFLFHRFSRMSLYDILYRPHREVSCILWANAGLLCIQTNYWFRRIDPIPGTNWILQIVEKHQMRRNWVLDRFATISIDSGVNSLFVLLGTEIDPGQRWYFSGVDLTNSVDYCETRIFPREYFKNETMSGDVFVRVDDFKDNTAIFEVLTSIHFTHPTSESGYGGRFRHDYSGQVEVRHPDPLIVARASNECMNCDFIIKW